MLLCYSRYSSVCVCLFGMSRLYCQTGIVKLNGRDALHTEPWSSSTLFDLHWLRVEVSISVCTVCCWSVWGMASEAVAIYRINLPLRMLRALYTKIHTHVPQYAYAWFVHASMGSRITQPGRTTKTLDHRTKWDAMLKTYTLHMFSVCCVWTENHTPFAIVCFVVRSYGADCLIRHCNWNQ